MSSVELKGNWFSLTGKTISQEWTPLTAVIYNFYNCNDQSDLHIFLPSSNTAYCLSYNYSLVYDSQTSKWVKVYSWLASLLSAPPLINSRNT